MDTCARNVVEYSVCIENVRFTLLYDTGFVNSLSTVPKPKERTLFHFHEYYELVYCPTPVEFSTPDFTKEYSMGQVFVIPPKTLHRIKPVNREPFESAVISFAVKKLAHTCDVNLFNIVQQVFSNVCSFKADEKYLKLIARFDINHSDTVVGDTLTMSLLFHQIITHIIKSATPYSLSVGKASVYDSDTSRTYKLNMLICTCYHQNITMEYVAKKLNISTRQLCRIIKSSYNCSFRDIITRFRMQEALQLLKNPEYSIAAIGFDVGYNSTKGFENAFKKYYGVVPSQYRKQLL